MRVRQDRQMAGQSIFWIIAVSSLTVMLVGWAIFGALTAPSATSLPEPTTSDAGNTGRNSLGGLSPSPPAWQKPPIPRLTEAQRNALQALETQCTKKNASACRKWAYTLVKYKGKTSYSTARKALLKGCQLKDGESCAELGQFYHLGMGAPPNPKQAVPWYKRACKLGYAGACTNLGILHMQGKGIPEDKDEARKLFKRACQRKSAIGCRNLAIAYFKGLGGQQRLRLSRNAFQKACKFKDKAACYRLGEIYEQGLGTRRNKRQARRFFKRACKLGVTKACNK